MPSTLPTQTEAVRLHERLLATDPVAPADLVAAYLEPLIAWLTQANVGFAADCCTTAAGDALVSLIKNPASYDSGLKELFPYLCMSARGDLLNLLRQERRHHKGRVPMKSVEDSPDAGKYLGRDDDPSLRLQAAEARDAPPDPAVAAVLASATPTERRVLELMLDGERRDATFAAVLGLADRPPAEQGRAVKRMKDRIKARLRRERRPT